MTSSVACHHRLWAAQTVERCRVWHAIIALGRQTQSNDVRRDMPSPPLDSTHGRTTSGVACHHRLGQQMVERHRAWHIIIAFGQHRPSDGVGRCMPSSPLASTHRRTTSGVACHHRLWAAQTVGRRRAWHATTALGQHTWSATFGVALHHRPWTAYTVGNLGRGMT